MAGKNLSEDVHEPLLKYGWLRAGIFLITALIMIAIMSSVGVIVVALIYGLDLSTLSTNARDLIRDLGIYANIIISLSGFLGMLSTAFFFRKFIDRRSILSLGFKFKNFKVDMLFGFILGVCLISAGFFYLEITDIIVIEAFSMNTSLFLGYIIFFLIAAINEEIMIRGYLLNNLMDSLNQYLALFLSSFLFAVLHLANANVTFLSFINILFAGILLGIYYIHRRNLWLPIALHFSWNFFQGPVYGFEVSGVKIQGVIVQTSEGMDLLTGGEFGFEGSIIATILMIGAIILLHATYSSSNKNSDGEETGYPGQ